MDLGTQMDRAVEAYTETCWRERYEPEDRYEPDADAERDRMIEEREWQEERDAARHD